VQGAGAAVLAVPGVYASVGRPAPARSRPGAVRALPEQHLLQDLRIVLSDGVEVFEPPRHSAVVTARLAVDEGAAALGAARSELEARLGRLDDRFPATPAGLGVTVGWGLPYFGRFVPGQAERLLPIDVRATARDGRTRRVLTATARFPSDPTGLVLEENDVAVLLRSDSLDHVQEAAESLFGDPAGPLRITSVRRGFAGGGFDGGAGLPKQLALAANVPGAELIPDGAELFLGFTSTQKQLPGRERIANLETLGYTDVRPGGYFAHGTHMHLSHLYEDLEAWYGRFSFSDRVASTFRPGLEVRAGTLTVRQAPEDAERASGVERDYLRHGRIGHSGSIQPASRLQHAVTGPDGIVYERGLPIPHRADFNTLDHPFAWSGEPERDGYGTGARPGLHFVVFNPSSDDFNRGRLAMDGQLPGGPALRFAPDGRGQGFNEVLVTTHRQNFLVPPRRHRSLPLSELRR
jgi:hypothetical protein